VRPAAGAFRCLERRLGTPRRGRHGRGPARAGAPEPHAPRQGGRSCRARAPRLLRGGRSRHARTPARSKVAGAAGATALAPLPAPGSPGPWAAIRAGNASPTPRPRQEEEGGVGEGSSKGPAREGSRWFGSTIERVRDLTDPQSDGPNRLLAPSDGSWLSGRRGHAARPSFGSRFLFKMATGTYPTGSTHPYPYLYP
jgi:hypothetical protein